MVDVFTAASAALALTGIMVIVQGRRASPQPKPKPNRKMLSEPIIEPIPDFAALGVTDPDLIREELRRGPSVDFRIGSQQECFTIPLRLVTYHSAPLAELLDPPHEIVALSLPDHDPRAFGKIQTWLNEGRFGPSLLNQCISSSHDIRSGIEDACLLLCLIYWQAEAFQMTEIQAQALAELRDSSRLAREMDHPFPLLPETVINIHQRSKTPSTLAEFLIEDMKIAAREGAVDMALYAQCFEECPDLKNAVLGDGVLDGIFAAWRRMAEDEAWDGDMVTIDAGRESGWWKGPF